MVKARMRENMGHWVAAATIGTGTSTAYLEWIPIVTGSVTSLSGLVLSIVMIRATLKRTRRDELVIQELEAKIATSDNAAPATHPSP